MAFFDALRRLFGGTDRNGGSGETGVAMIPCDEASARLFEYLDGELEGVSEEEVRRHLEVCEACYPRVQFEKHFLEALRRSHDDGPVSEDLRDRVLRSLAEDEGHTPD